MFFIRFYIGYFFVYAFIGWIMEVSFQAVKTGRFINRGFLNGPLCPIYGFGALGVIYFLTDIAKTNKLVLFFGSVFIATALELVGGFLLEKIFHKKWWDYSDMRFNLGGYICLEFSILWGLACFVLYEAVHPMIVRFFELLNPKFIFYGNIILLAIFAVDMAQTILTLVGLNKKFKKLQAASADIREVSDDIGKRVYDRTMTIKEKSEEIKDRPRVKEIEAKRAQIRADLIDKFDKMGERRLIKAFPNLIEDFVDKVDKDLDKIDRDIKEIEKNIEK
ncbi:hypothetical protein K8P03_06905 [Anaerococcus murdochii]|uniref:ABC-transporter type IV n=1 Tax=Anaerococcus murdochii TaxID=411577 RepID=A0ABS7SZQ4_9FIRM|nr:hypothetical protein [Anaerococcus murdochii]MBZ2387009.1 hypothetical protein [Anaerococcus murdochii]